MSSFSNKRVWFITGCSSGFGKDLTEAVLQKGERVVATLRRPEVLSHLADKYTRNQLLVVPLDVRFPNQIDDAFNVVKSTFGRLDVVVNNAGHGLLGEVEGTDDATARNLFDVLLWGAVDISRKAVTFFRDINPSDVGGRILQVSSMGGFVGYPMGAFYHAGKFALEGFSEALQAELPPQWNIRVTIIEPGGFRTEWARSSLPVLPQHPAYKDPSTPSSQVRAYIFGPYAPKGDPAKAAQAMIKIADLDDPPMRIPLGVDALEVVKGKCMNVLEEVEKYKEIGKSCLADGEDEELSEVLKASIKD